MKDHTVQPGSVVWRRRRQRPPAEVQGLGILCLVVGFLICLVAQIMWAELFGWTMPLWAGGPQFSWDRFTSVVTFFVMGLPLGWIFVMLGLEVLRSRKSFVCWVVYLIVIFTILSEYLATRPVLWCFVLLVGFAASIVIYLHRPKIKAVYEIQSHQIPAGFLLIAVVVILDGMGLALLVNLLMTDGGQEDVAVLAIAPLVAVSIEIASGFGLLWQRKWAWKLAVGLLLIEVVSLYIPGVPEIVDEFRGNHWTDKLSLSLIRIAVLIHVVALSYLVQSKVRSRFGIKRWPFPIPIL